MKTSGSFLVTNWKFLECLAKDALVKFGNAKQKILMGTKVSFFCSLKEMDAELLICVWIEEVWLKIQTS